MHSVDYQEVFEQLPGAEKGFNAHALRNGLIHSSYRVETGSGEDYFVQRINANVFNDPGVLVKNYLALYDHVENQELDFLMPAPVSFSAGEFLFRDTAGRSWRLFRFIPGTTSHETASNVSQVAAVAGAFGLFQQVFHHLDPAVLSPVLPGFHDLRYRYEQFARAKESAYRQRLLLAGTILDALEERKQYVTVFDNLAGNDAFPIRIMHHDAKMGNVLFDRDRVVSVVDFDTAMPGYVFSDLGDMIRSMAGLYPGQQIHQGFYEAILEAYLEKTVTFLTTVEKKQIHFSGLMMTYMQALRFTADFLTGDQYYRVTDPMQNLERAKEQIRLLENLEGFLLKNYSFTC